MCEYLDIKPPCDITALLEKTAVLPDHADVHRDVELLGGEEHVHVVHVLGCAVPTGGKHQHSCNNLERHVSGKSTEGDDGILGTKLLNNSKGEGVPYSP